MSSSAADVVSVVVSRELGFEIPCVGGRSRS